MPTLKIPVNSPFWSNAEPESKKAGIVAVERRDVLKDAVGSTIRRPAFIPFASGLPEPADGQYYWEEEDLVYIVSGGNLYSLAESSLLTLVDTGLYGSGKYVTWAESANLELVTTGAVRKLWSTNGGRIVEYDGTTASVLNGANDPVQSSHIINFDTYNLSNELSDERYDESIWHSKVAEPSNFEGASFSAENKSDPIKAMHSQYDEIALFGTKVLENFYNNNVAPFVAIPGGNVPQGTLSPWTIKPVDNAWFLLNRNRQVIRIDGRQATVLSEAIDRILDESVDAVNAEGNEVTLNGVTLYLLKINDRTFVFDYAANEWAGEWARWDTEKAEYAPLNARNFINVKPWNMTLCTDSRTGAIYKLSFDDYRDQWL